MWDLGIAANGDVILAGNRDLSGVSGTALLEQRMKMRLRLHRGEWTYDTRDTFGSNLYKLMGMPPANAAQIAPAYVREALRGMDEIVIEDVKILTGTSSITLIVFYRVSDVTYAAEEEQVRQVEISLPLSGGSF